MKIHATSPNVTQLLIALPAYASFDSHAVDARTKQKPFVEAETKQKPFVGCCYTVVIPVSFFAKPNQMKICTKLVKLVHNMEPKF